MSTYMGQNYGARKLERIRLGMREMIKVMILVSVAMSLVTVVFGRYIIALFITGEPWEVASVSDIAYRYTLVMSSLLFILYLLHLYRASLQGLVMGTRSGNIDPMLVEFLAKKERLDIAGVMDILNKKLGVAGISGVFGDFRDLGIAADHGNQRARLALDVFAYQVAKYIGSYAAAMNGVDIIAFMAGIGENAVAVRAEICSYLDYLDYLGICFDPEANQVYGEEREISTPGSKVKVMVIPTNEELAIARETAALV